jgi:hypothetical protein
MFVMPSVHGSNELNNPAEFDKPGMLKAGNGALPDFSIDVLTPVLYEIPDCKIKQLAFNGRTTPDAVENRRSKKAASAVGSGDTESQRLSGILGYPASP